MKNVGNWVVKFSKWVTLFLGLILLAALSYISLKTRGYIYMTRAEAVTFFNNGLLFYVALFIAIAFFFLAYKTLGKIPSVILYLCGAGVFVIFAAYLVPNVDGLLRADPHYLFKAAIQMNTGDYSSFDKINTDYYMSTFPNQMGLLSLFRIYAHFTTNASYLYLVQLVMVLGCNFLLWRITNLLYGKQALNNVVILLSFLFLPPLFLILWVYGDIPGLLCLLLSLYFYIYFRNKNKLIYGLLSVLFITLACFVRANYQIFLVVLFIIQGLSLVQKFNYKKLLVILLLFPSVKLSNVWIQSYYESKIHQEITYPPATAWIVMGLNDRVSSPGYWDAYTTFIRVWNDYDDQRVEAVVKKDLEERIHKLTESPNYAQDFFKRKIAVTWNEPTFQSIYAGMLLEREQHTYTDFLQNLYEEGSYYHYYNKYMSIVLTSIYLLSSLYILIKFFIFREDITLVELYPFLFFIGGFTFHLFWEVKSRYVWPYVYLLLPVVATNISYLSQKFKWKEKK